MSPRRLCRPEKIPEGGGRGFRFGSGPDLQQVLVVRWRGVFRVYENACPHLGTPLNFLPDRFFDRGGEYLLCATHGALFRVDDGFCVGGPCAGKSLKPLATRVVEQELVLVDRSENPEASS